MILQAAAWLAALRDDLGRIVGLSTDGPRLDELELPSVDFRVLRRSLFRTASEHHQHKYAAAIAEEASLMHPRWAARMGATAGEYLANPAEGETEVYRRSMAALKRAGL